MTQRDGLIKIHTRINGCEIDFSLKVFEDFIRKTDHVFCRQYMPQHKVRSFSFVRDDVFAGWPPVHHVTVVAFNNGVRRRKAVRVTNGIRLEEMCTFVASDELQHIVPRSSKTEGSERVDLQGRWNTPRTSEIEAE